MFDIRLEPHEQEISVPELVERILNPPGRRTTKSSTSFREWVYELVENEKNSAARKDYRDKVQRTILDEISNGRLIVAKYGNREIILVASLVRWTFSYGKNVMQSGVEGRESYAAAAKTEMLKHAFLMASEPQGRSAGEREAQAAELTDKGVTTAQIVQAFGNLVAFRLGKAMTDRAEWTVDARISNGTKGGRHKSTWNPVIIATALHERKGVPLPKLNQAFHSCKFLADWREEWDRFSLM